MDKFKLVSSYKPTGDQPQAIDKLVEGLDKGFREQVLLGVTGSGKTFTMANVIARVNRPTLVLAHNKTLAAQLCSELKEFFPENAVEYFVSYYDYYQPEAYLPHTDTFIEKDMSINEDIDRLRHSATSSLFERKDVIVVASVSCIYTLGDPAEYHDLMVSARVGQQIDRDTLLKDLVKIRYVRNDYDLARGMFRVRGDVVEVFPSSTNEYIVRIEFFGDEIDRITEINPVTGEVLRILNYIVIFPATHYVTGDEKREKAIDVILNEMEERVAYFESENKLIEAQRIRERTMYDVEFLRQLGYCKGIENYSRVMSGREPGATPYTLLDYFPKDYLMIIDESHASLPQVRGMSGGDRARKSNLINFGFRLPSAYDNRPLNFTEFNDKLNQVIYVSATPGQYERERSSQIVEQIIRPTGLVDPQISVRPSEGQIDDLVSEIRKRIEKHERVLVVTLTKRMSESLTEYLENLEIRVKYMHHEVDTLDRIEILRQLREGEFDVLVGINLLREGLDLPEVSLIAILDADKEGFLRNETSLIQIIGRAARNAEGQVIMYADSVTPSMERALKETDRRRSIQTAYNKEHNITPKTIVKPIQASSNISAAVADAKKLDSGEFSPKNMSAKERKKLVDEFTQSMKAAAKALEFEYAAELRDKIKKLEQIK
ncbi:MAG: excinuclease ABC subunit B [Clostridiales bacterium]|nr:MAG: excinuclease ABC subunit B [Clostridiales bacterium]